MYAQVGHDAHGGLFLIKEPHVFSGADAPGFRAAVAEAGAEGDDIADQALIDQPLGLHMGLGQALIVADHQEFAVLFRTFHHGLAVGQGGGHGLFAQDVLAGVQGLDAQLRVGVVGGADGDRVDVRVGKKRLGGVIDLPAVFVRLLLGPGPVGAEKGRQLCIRVLRIFGDVPHLGNFSAANDTDVDHGSLLLIRS